MAPGDIYRHDSFYLDLETGELLPKYFVVLAVLPGGDLVIRLLTSRPHARPENPRCFHGHPYPSYFLGVPGGQLGTKTWLDLRYLADADALDIQRLEHRGTIKLAMTLDAKTMAALLECGAGAEDTTQLQERVMRDHLAKMR